MDLTLYQRINDQLYFYSGVNQQKERVHGTCHARSRNAAIDTLQSQGIQLTILTKKYSAKFFSKNIKHQDIVIFTKQLAIMLRSGLSIIQCLEITANISNNNTFNMMITDIKISLENGLCFSESLNSYPKQFPLFYRNLLKVGENTGSLDLMLLRITEHQEKMLSLKAQFKKTLLYPGLVVSVAIIVTIILLVYVVPQFESIFSNLNSTLPWFTLRVLNGSRWLQKYGFYSLILTLTVCYLLIYCMKRSTKITISIDTLVLKIPIIGTIINKIYLVRFSRTLHTLLTAGVPLLNSLPMTANLIDNMVYKNAICDTIIHIENGQLLNNSMRYTRIFNNMVIQMITIGENTGTLNDMLLKIAEIYENEINYSLTNLSSIIEPMIILIISVLVGGLIAAMYLPIFSLGSIL